jgi:hypothetical protein
MSAQARVSRSSIDAASGYADCETAVPIETGCTTAIWRRLLGQECRADHSAAEAHESPDPLQDGDENHQITCRVQKSCHPEPFVGISVSNESAKFDVN